MSDFQKSFSESTSSIKFDEKYIDTSVQPNDIGVAEQWAVKTVADLYIPISGTVIAVNENLDNNPEAVNDTPYGDGWMVKIEIANQDEISDLLTATTYENLIS